MNYSWKHLVWASLLVVGVITLDPIGSSNLEIARAAHSNQLTISAVSDPAGGTEFSFSVDRPGTCTTTGVTLDDGDSSTPLTCDTDGSWIIDVTPAQGWRLGAITCEAIDEGDTGLIQSVMTIDVEDIENESLQITINDDEHVVCEFTFDQATGGGIFGTDFAIAVTAAPNVIPCGGTSLITATLRDPEGHVVNGVGFHFETDFGTLIMGPPNTADQTQNSAILSLQPGLPAHGQFATVKAWVGAFSEFPGVVTVQQFCPGVTTNDASIAPGLISLSASTPTLNCGESAFIGARVRDSKNQVPPDGTIVNFLSSNGTLSAPGSDARTGALSTTTINGVLNVMFTAGGSTSSSPVRITAASGDAFGSITLQVNCVAAAPAAAAPGTGGAGRAPAPCVPIGDGVCITPPNTGDGGMK